MDSPSLGHKAPQKLKPHKMHKVNIMIIIQDGDESFPRFGTVKLTWKLSSGQQNIPNKKKIYFFLVKKAVKTTLLLKPNQTKAKQK